MGSFTVELYPSFAPKTCKNFEELARRGYYDGTILHRIIPDFMVQCGDPTGTGRGGESIYGGKFPDEIRRELKHVGGACTSLARPLRRPQTPCLLTASLLTATSD